MKKKKIISLVIFLTVGLLLGLYCGQTTIFIIIFITAITGLSCFIFLISYLADRMMNKTSSGTTILGLFALALTVALVTAMITIPSIADYKQKLAEEIIPKIEKYKVDNSKYPQTLSSLSDIKPTDTEKLRYIIDTMQQKYSVRVIIDGWHYLEWDSKTKQWNSGD